MSAARINVQQFPRAGGTRACVIADDGYAFASADLSGIELRAAAAVAEDQGLAEMLRQGLDLHALIALMVWGEDPQDPGNPRKADRYLAKRFVFARLYGAGRDKLASTLGPHRAAVDAAMAAMDQLIPGYVAWAARLRENVRSGLTSSHLHPSGRTTWLPKAFPHKAPNYVIQSTAREVLVDALLRWRETPWGHATLVPIHDEILVQVPADQAEEASMALVECMTTWLPCGSGPARTRVPVVAAVPKVPVSRFWQDAE